ncbi:MAG: ABC transporter permease subunit [bacterium]|nr:ABC transporter permease subunit [bacterium]
MRGAVTIFRREFAGLFLSPLAWILLLVSLFVNGFFFVQYLGIYRGDVTGALRASLGGSWPFWFFLVLLPPLLAMRLVSEEARNGTLEFLLTGPVGDASVVVGKFLAALAFLAILWLSVLVYALRVQTVGTPPDWGPALGGYLGAVLASGLFVAIGLLVSSLTNTPLLAAFLAFMACLGWLILPIVGANAFQSIAALLADYAGGVEVAHAWVLGALNKMDVLHHFQSSFLLGVFDTSEVVFFLTWTALFLFLTVRSLEARRWRA